MKLKTFKNLSDEERKKIDDYCLSQYYYSIYENEDIPLFLLIDIIQDGNLEILNLLIRAGIDVYLGDSLLMFESMTTGNTEVVQMFINAGIDATDERFICKAASCHSWNIVRLLLNNGANASAKYNTPIKYALESNNAIAVSMLVEAGAKFPKDWTCKYFKTKDTLKIVDILLNDYTKTCTNRFHLLIVKIIRKAVRKLK